MAMRQFFNIQRTEGAIDIYLYGEIGDYADVRCGQVAAELMSAPTGARVNVRINSIGGEVYSGIAIYNAVRNSRGDVHIYIDGVAASMAGVIALCGRPVSMSRYARLMLHSVSGGCYGNRRELEHCLSELGALEDSLADIIGRRLGMDAAAVKAKYFDGQDHWMTAEEALAGGFVDGIYDSPEEEREERGGEEREGSGDEELAGATTPEQIYAIYNNRLLAKKGDQKPNKMDLKELRKRARFAACADEAAALAELDKLEAEAGKASALEGEVAELKAKVAEHEKEREERAESERKALLDAAERDGRITSQSRGSFEALLKADAVNGKAALEAMKPRRNALHDIVQGGGERGERAGGESGLSGKSWNELDRAGKLGELKAKMPEVYRAKYKERFGVEPSI